MALHSSRIYVLACTISAAAVVAVYVWVKRKKKRERPCHREDDVDQMNVQQSVSTISTGTTRRPSLTETLPLIPDIVRENQIEPDTDPVAQPDSVCEVKLTDSETSIVSEVDFSVADLSTVEDQKVEVNCSLDSVADSSNMATEAPLMLVVDDCPTSDTIHFSDTFKLTSPKCAEFIEDKVDAGLNSSTDTSSTVNPDSTCSTWVESTTSADQSSCMDTTSTDVSSCADTTSADLSSSTSNLYSDESSFSNSNDSSSELSFRLDDSFVNPTHSPVKAAMAVPIDLTFSDTEANNLPDDTLSTIPEESENDCSKSFYHVNTPSIAIVEDLVSAPVTMNASSEVLCTAVEEPDSKERHPTPECSDNLSLSDDFKVKCEVNNGDEQQQLNEEDIDVPKSCPCEVNDEKEAETKADFEHEPPVTSSLSLSTEDTETKADFDDVPKSCPSEVSDEKEIETKVDFEHEPPVASSPSLSTEEPELQKLTNGNVTSAYGSSSHSPAEELLNSPTASTYSDLHSEGSSDSGKGGSDINTHLNVESYVSNRQFPQKTVYEFEIPHHLCGRMIGYKGQHVRAIKTQTSADITIYCHPYNTQHKMCAVVGNESEIQAALTMIRKRFPISKYPDLSLAQINIQMVAAIPIPIPETLVLNLPHGVTCDVILSSLVNAGHFFVQQPTHPTYSSLRQLDQVMLCCYAEAENVPTLPTLDAGVICAAEAMGGWYRAQVVGVHPDNDICDIRFLDYGGYTDESITNLRQIRSDFMTLPFQASECYLANVAPIDESGWTTDATQFFEDLAQGQILQAQIVSYSEDGIPYVQLYRVQGAMTTFINQELINVGYARWVDHQT